MNVPWKPYCQGYMAEVGDLRFLIIPTGPRSNHWSVGVLVTLSDTDPKWKSQVALEAFGDCRSVKQAKADAERAGDYIQAAYDGVLKLLDPQT